jgi:dephospho-CoA kinase
VALPALAHEFGPDIVAADGSMDRARMRHLVFSDEAAKRRLESILHPMIGTEGLRQAEAADPRPVVFDVPLLTASSHWRGRVARVLVVDCLESTQVQRVMQRSGWSEAQVRRVIAQQATRAARRALADAVIFNDGLSQAALAVEVQLVWNRWNAMERHGAWQHGGPVKQSSAAS